MDASPPVKTCTKCGQEKPFESFGLKGKGAAYREAMCRPCKNEYQLAWRASRPELVAEYAKRNRRRELAMKYGLSRSRYEEIARAQQHSCPICRRSLAEVLAVVDHDHDSGLVRGVLCQQCNRAIGLLGDDWQSLGRAMRYLKAKPWDAVDCELDELLPPGGGKGAVNRRKTHCPSGHLYDELNTAYSKAGTRRCKTCVRDISYAKWRAANPDAPARGRTGARVPKT